MPVTGPGWGVGIPKTSNQGQPGGPTPLNWPTNPKRSTQNPPNINPFGTNQQIQNPGWGGTVGPLRSMPGYTPSAAIRIPEWLREPSAYGNYFRSRRPGTATNLSVTPEMIRRAAVSRLQ